MQDLTAMNDAVAMSRYVKHDPDSNDASGEALSGLIVDDWSQVDLCDTGMLLLPTLQPPGYQPATLVATPVTRSTVTDDLPMTPSPNPGIASSDPGDIVDTWRLGGFPNPEWFPDSDSDWPEDSDSDTICKLCGRDVGHSNELRRHLRHHLKPIKCAMPSCLIRFATKRDMLRHNAAQHSVGEAVAVDPITCHLCKKNFTRRDNRLRHMQQTHAEPLRRPRNKPKSGNKQSSRRQSGKPESE